MEMVLNGIPNLKLHQHIRDDDQVDQLHSYVTVYLLVLAAVVTGLKEIAGQPLDCWESLGKWAHYQTHVNRYCWETDLYPYPNPDNMSEMPYSLHQDGNHRNESVEGVEVKTLNSHRWVTLLFIIQAILFKLPDLVWAECNTHSGTKIEQIVAMIKAATLKPMDDRQTDLNVVARFLDTWLRINGRDNLDPDPGQDRVSSWGYFVHRKSKFLSSMYVVVKIWYLVNLVAQFYILSQFMDLNFWDYSDKLTYNEASNDDVFPLTALCNFKMKSYSAWVQCLMTLNMWVKRILTIQWLWFLILMVLTLCNLLGWIPKIFRKQAGLEFIKHFSLDVLCKRVNSNKIQTTRGTSGHFVSDYLGQDGVFLLRLIAINVSSVAMAELVACLWNRYLDDQIHEVMVEKDIALGMGYDPSLLDRQTQTGISKEQLLRRREGSSI